MIRSARFSIRGHAVFWFADSFITMIRNLHHNTNARFVVNGMLSDPILVLTGIRHDCPLAPLLFLLVAEIPAIALLQSTQIRGLRHPGLPTVEQKVFTFVDDSTIFTPRRANYGGTVHRASFWEVLRDICATSTKRTDPPQYSGRYIRF